MFDFLAKIPPLYLTIIAGCFTWGITALGASMVFFFKTINKKILNLLMGFAAGVMIAATFWSLLTPSIEMSAELGYIKWLHPALGFLCGGLFVVIAAKLLDKTTKFKADNPENVSKKRSFLLVMSITLHNIPEGLSVGVVIGALASGVPGSDIVAATLLAIGIGIQNFPEGASVSLPLRRDGMKRGKAFFYGQASGFVELISAVIGFFLASAIKSALPFSLAFSGGAMIAVVASELLPESVSENKVVATIGCIVGFVVMMILDVALG